MRTAMLAAVFLSAALTAGEVQVKPGVTWTVTEAAEGKPILTNRDYKIIQMQKELAGSWLIQRSARVDDAVMLSPSNLVVDLPIDLYCAVVNPTEQIVSDAVAKGWTKVDGTFDTTTPGKEVWTWAVFKISVKEEPWPEQPTGKLRLFFIRKAAKPLPIITVDDVRRAQAKVASAANDKTLTTAARQEKIKAAGLTHKTVRVDVTSIVKDVKKSNPRYFIAMETTNPKGATILQVNAYTDDASALDLKVGQKVRLIGVLSNDIGLPEDPLALRLEACEIKR